MVLGAGANANVDVAKMARARGRDFIMMIVDVVLGSSSESFWFYAHPIEGTIKGKRCAVPGCCHGTARKYIDSLLTLRAVPTTYCYHPFRHSTHPPQSTCSSSSSLADKYVVFKFSQALSAFHAESPILLHPPKNSIGIHAVLLIGGKSKMNSSIEIKFRSRCLQLNSFWSKTVPCAQC